MAQQPGLDDQSSQNTEPPAPEVQVKQPGSCRYGCGYVSQAKDNLAKGRDLSVHYRNKHKDEMKKETVTKKIEEVKNREEEVYANIRLRGKDALHELMRERLDDLLTAPGIADQSKEYALSEWDSDPALRDDLNQLARMLTDDAGLKPDKALRIVEKLYNLIEPFLPALEDRGDRPPFFFGPMLRERSPPPRGYGRDYYGRGYGGGYGEGYDPRWQSRYSDPYYDRYPPERPLTREDVARTVGDEVRKVLDVSKPKPENVVTIYEPVTDSDGDPVFDEGTGKPITIPVQLPASVAMAYLANKRTAGTEKAREGLSPEVKIQIDKMESELKESRKETAEILRKFDDKEKEELAKRAENAEQAAKEAKSEVQKVREEVKATASSKVVEGYQNDSYRLIGQGLEKIGTVGEKIVAKWDGPGSTISKLLGPAKPGANQQQETEASSVIEEELHKRGLS